MKLIKAKSRSILTNRGFASIPAGLSVLCLLLAFGACRQKKDDNLLLLSPTDIYKINIAETSDLCLDPSISILYTVSDNTGKVYKLTTNGRVLSALSYTGGDLEGVTIDEDKNVYIAEERLRKIIKLDALGNEIYQKTIPVEINNENNGLEGVAYASFNNHFYIINEMNPSVLIETDKSLNKLYEYQLTFANDYSGICVDNTNQKLWILSDMSATVNICTLQGELIESYRIPVTNPEGIAYDPQSNKLYIISDSESKLYVFTINTK